MTDASIDILMITYNRAEYTRLALSRLLQTCDETMRVWVWHNGNDAATLDVVRAQESRLHKLYHSPDNKKLREPTNWLWSQAKGAFLCKVDDDCIMPAGWADTLRRAHADEPRFGVLGCWRFPEEDFLPEVAAKKIQGFPGGHRIMRNCWVEGSGYLMKRRCVDENGLLREGQSWVQYCIGLAAAGWINGWYFPFLYQEHMDDPRSPNTLLKTDADMQKFMPLSARKNDVPSLDQWRAQLKRSAHGMQEASFDPRHYTGWRKTMKNAKTRVKRLFGVKAQW